MVTATVSLYHPWGSAPESVPLVGKHPPPNAPRKPRSRACLGNGKVKGRHTCSVRGPQEETHCLPALEDNPGMTHCPVCHRVPPSTSSFLSRLSEGHTAPQQSCGQHRVAVPGGEPQVIFPGTLLFLCGDVLGLKQTKNITVKGKLPGFTVWKINGAEKQVPSRLAQKSPKTIQLGEWRSRKGQN